MAVTAVSICAYVHFGRYVLSEFSGRQLKLFALASLSSTLKLGEDFMTTAVPDSSLACAREYLETATRLRYWASKLRTNEARTKVSRLAELYEEISFCYVEQQKATM